MNLVNMDIKQYMKCQGAAISLTAFPNNFHFGCNVPVVGSKRN
jgi:hypothetical protein